MTSHGRVTCDSLLKELDVQIVAEVVDAHGRVAGLVGTEDDAERRVLAACDVDAQRALTTNTPTCVRYIRNIYSRIYSHVHHSSYLHA